MPPTAGTQSAPVTLSDRYFHLLVFGLMGYAVLGKGFAYIGIPPLFIGEIMLGLGAIVLLRSGTLGLLLGTSSGIVLALLAGWTVLRTVPFIGEYAIDALRDSVIVLYCGYAFVVASLFLEKPERIKQAMHYFAILSIVMVFVSPGLLILSDATVHEFSEDVAWVAAKSSVTGVHLGAAALMALLGFRKVGPLWIAFLVVGMAIVSTQNRGGMLAMLIPFCAAVAISGKWRSLIVPVAIGVVLLTILAMLDVSIATSRGRDMSVRQLLENFTSVAQDGQAGGDQDATKRWRLSWWGDIVDYTLRGPYFWTGKGFGVNLAISDGHIVGLENPFAPLLRSPHNSHLTILARAGVPGMVMWAATYAIWVGSLAWAYVVARTRGEEQWANYFLFIGCYASGFLIDAFFDVALEGPMSGIWFWSLYGCGWGSVLVYSAQVRYAHKAARLRSAPA